MEVIISFQHGNVVIYAAKWLRLLKEPWRAVRLRERGGFFEWYTLDQSGNSEDGKKLLDAKNILAVERGLPELLSTLLKPLHN